MIYIIDGYNVLHTRETDGMTKNQLEAKRHELVEETISFMASTGDEAYIIFDSSVSDSPVSHRIADTAVTVCFSSASESADILIGKLVQQKLAATKDEVRVVSGDWEVQKGALMKRVERIPPRNFLADMKKFAKGVAIHPEMGRMRWKIEDKVDVETLRKLEEMRRGRG